MKAQTLKGTRDILPQQLQKRKYIFDTISTIFTQYGFAQIETPAMEAMTTLSGKYGEEGDKLLFKILNNGDFLEKANQEALNEKNSNKLAASIAKRGLRYDLTVPFARFVVNNQNDLVFPFKRYQIQPVWRADRPQRGRYQEFYQCDADVVGSESLLYEAELVQIYQRVFAALNLDVKIKLNNRKILFGLAEEAGIADKFVDMTVAIDKLDKIGKEKVAEELQNRGIDETATAKIFELLAVEDLASLNALFTTSETGRKGVEELTQVLSYLGAEALSNVAFDIKLARGLGYYTGCILEVAVDTDAHPGMIMGSIGGGGRYADLTGTFGMNGLSGVGISFGVERIYDVMEELNLFPADACADIKIVLMGMDDASLAYAFKLASALRAKGIAVDIYPEAGKLKKQIKYAADKGVTFAGIIGESEVAGQTVSVKNLVTGEQQSVASAELSDYLMV